MGDINSYGLDKVYILTLPAFQWFEAPATGDISGTVRSTHHCQVIGQRQMLSIGGHGNDYDDQDPWKNGLGIFDMTELTWGFDYNANAAPYVPPPLITKYYNTSNRYPTFDNASLAAVINTTTTVSSVSSNNSSSISSTNNSTSTPGIDSNSSTTSRKSNIGAIAGGIAGGIAVVILGLLGYIFWLRDQNQKRQEIHNTKLSSDSISILPAKPIGMHEMDEQRRIAEMNAGLRPEMDEQRGVAELNAFNRGVAVEMDGTGTFNGRNGRI